MKSKIVFIVAVLFAMIWGCSSPDAPITAPVQPIVVQGSDRLEVYCFHGTRQCETCKNMKANTRETLERYFSNELKDSTIVFSIIDVDDEANAGIAEKFEASGTALMVNVVREGRDSILDWSDFAFEKANNFDEYLPELKAKIDEVNK